MRILLIEDDKKTSSFITKGLKEAGFSVDLANDGQEALLILGTTKYDLLIVDLMLPRLDGLSLIKQIRRDDHSVAILILSAKHALDFKVKGLNLGADDYLTKPFSFIELLARINALLRRKENPQRSNLLQYADMEIDLMSQIVMRGDKKIDLMQKEYSLLKFFMLNPERVITRTMILEHVWDMNFDPTTNVVDVLVCRLRDKIDRGCSSKLIHTIRGVGYVLRKDL